jgi:hypothetical protein
MKKFLIFVIAMLGLSQNLSAKIPFSGIGLKGAMLSASESSTGEVDNMIIKSIGIFAVEFSGIPAGTAFIQLKKALQLGGNCNSDAVFIKKETDSDGRMFALLKDAVNLRRSVTMLVTDDPAIIPFEGTCAVVIVGLKNS